MEKLPKNLKFKIALIFLVPAIGLLFFSSSYVYEKYSAYTKSLYLEQTVRYTKHTLNLIKSLQKERGLSIACLQSHTFCQKLKLQRAITNQKIHEYQTYLLHNAQVYSPFMQDHFNTIVERIKRIEALRNTFDKNRLDMIEVLNRYSAVIKELIHSIELLEHDFLNDTFFKTIVSFNTILKIAEINGQERALIAYMIGNEKKNDTLFQKLLRLEIELQELEKRLKHVMPVKIRIVYNKTISLKKKEQIQTIKQKIINNRPVAIDKTRWWRIATNYIDTLFVVEEAILKDILAWKERLKHEAQKALFVSIAIWLGAIVSLLLFVKIFSSLLHEFTQYFKESELEKRMATIFSKFSENILFIHNEIALLNAYAILINRTELFQFLFLFDCKRHETLFSENITPAAISELQEKYIVDLIQKAKREQQYYLEHFPKLPKEFGGIEGFLVFPLHYKKECRYLLVAGIKNVEDIKLHILDQLYRMTELCVYGLEQIELQQKEKALTQELKLLSHTFNAHEAITITDASGKILRVNKAFEDITGYKAEEVIGKNPSILKSGIHDKEFYQQMWDAIKHQGYWKGEIYNKKKDGTIYPEVLSITAIKDENGEISNYVAHFFDVSELKEAEDEIKKRIELDLLTEVFNRKKMVEELEVVRKNAIKEGYCNAFFFIDLDNFKYINDSYGHFVGDEVLKEVAKNLKAVVKDGDIVARIAGDEFALILVDLAKNKEQAVHNATLVAEKLISEYSGQKQIGGYDLDINFSIGIYIFPAGEQSVDEIITNADIAMYNSKKSGRNRFTFYNEALDLESKRFLVMKKAIERGLKEKEFELYYQPKVDASNEKIVGMEGLLRWNSKEYGLLFPDKFFPYTRGNRLLYEITDYVLDEALQMIQILRESGYLEVKVSINISAEQFINRKYVETLLKKIQNSHYADGLIFEIVEDALIQNVEYAKDLIKTFRKYCVEIAIDDFGTGYSSLSYLRDLDVDEIKIDKSFVLDLFEHQNDKLVEKIIEIGKIFGYKVTAEGVENAQSMQFLKERGCDYLQGFYFSRAVRKEAILRMLG
ncbi:EAL domain-containing protein [Nitratiruptor sp. SB155-2]|uniref:EAL domain-containing protein n=1 Tax=Nitratiruptor sp. (strain SB155-2) TaxID=387092 RepID=UPI0001586EF8|nr:EAL domain-containing protein [Nitratiruptor sp. SB155-2]BAF69540.1 hypothetical protein NIS_0426 [Nitratiruptor sp. SB155-2]